jgi:hypothetical protein
MKTRIAAVAAAALSAACTATAGAAPDTSPRTYQQTYPVATRLCAAVAQGEGPAHLRPYAAQALAGCVTLENGYNAALAARLAALEPVVTALASERHAAPGACLHPRQQAPACALERQSRRAAIKSLEGERRSVVRAFHQALEANRQAFWGTIHALPGCAGVY